MSSRAPLRSLAVLGVVLSLAAAATPAGAMQPNTRTPMAPRVPLPADRLHFGISDFITYAATSPDVVAFMEPTWLVDSAVPWKYRYNELGGGVGTGGKGWEHFLDWVPAPLGEYALEYMKRSGSHGYTPLLMYYMICQSKGIYPNACDGTPLGESNTDFNNVNDPGLMKLYYENFKLLMTKAAAYNKLVVIDVETDFWGLMEVRAKKAGSYSAASITASVASSGMPELTGIPNTVQGFAWALLRLRDLNAPNVLMTIHSSTFGNSGAVTNLRDTIYDVNADADGIVLFMNSAGIASNPFGSTWDAMTIDLDIRDAAWYEAYGYNTPTETHWWDPANIVFPNFTRYLAWAKRLHDGVARPLILLGVPMGNQYFLTMNNTPGHWQDNKAPYFIGHPNEVLAAGIQAVIFTPGNGRDVRQTSNTDAEKDGITNNGGVPTTDVQGWCIACNTNVSRYADDDGGYLRLAVGAYYAATVPGMPQSALAEAGASSAWVSWQLPVSNGGLALTGFTITTNPGGAVINVGPTTTGVLITGLTNGTSYTFTITAVNTVGAGAGATTNLVTPSINARLSASQSGGTVLPGRSPVSQLPNPVAPPVPRTPTTTPPPARPAAAPAPQPSQPVPTGTALAPEWWPPNPVFGPCAW